VNFVVHSFVFSLKKKNFLSLNLVKNLDGT